MRNNFPLWISRRSSDRSAPNFTVIRETSGYLLKTSSKWLIATHLLDHLKTLQTPILMEMHLLRMTLHLILYPERFLGCLPVEQFCESFFAGISIVETQKNIEMLTGYFINLRARQIVVSAPKAKELVVKMEQYTPFHEHVASHESWQMEQLGSFVPGRHGGLLCNPLEPPTTCLMGNSKELPHFVQQQQLLRGATHHLTGNSKELPHFEQQQQLLHGAAHHLLDGKLADNLDC
ncbi:hypothetical protein L3X38_016055 [Prunus dulcis]|uniref:Uncharacterized protein n=1 Tax=Prunus dulcis TaxID=3755 RepID=A0AAD4Z8T0_PRUDU|nr:hypothetical protein L3X38_016055 [Prunus dulcis]